MNDPVGDLTIRFAETNRQEQQWLRDEIKELRTIIAILIKKAGGKVYIYDKDERWFRNNGDAIRFKSYEDKDNRRTVIELMKTCDTCDGSGKVHSHNPLCWTCGGKGYVRHD